MHTLRRFFSTKLPKVFLDISINGEDTGRLIFELKIDIVPKTAENFRMLCIGGSGKTKNGIENAQTDSSV